MPSLVFCLTKWTSGELGLCFYSTVVEGWYKKRWYEVVYYFFFPALF